MINCYEEAIGEVFQKTILRNPLFVFGCEFMLRCIWDAEQKRHLEREEVIFRSWLPDFISKRIALKLVNRIYSAIESFTDENRYTNLYVYAEKKPGIKTPIVINHFLKNEV